MKYTPHSVHCLLKYHGKPGNNVDLIINNVLQNYTYNETLQLILDNVSIISCEMNIPIVHIR